MVLRATSLGQDHQQFSIALGAVANDGSTLLERGFRIPGVDGGGGYVDEETIGFGPFATLTRLDGRQRSSGSVLVVMAMSGHSALLLRDLVGGLVGHGLTVSVLDWVDARLIPKTAGSFGFDDMVSRIVDAMARLPVGTHLVGVCQAAVPALMAAAVMSAYRDAHRPRTLSLIAGPIDPRRHPTRVSTMLAATPRAWLEACVIEAVPPGSPGSGRLVYPAETQLNGLRTYAARHAWQGGPFAHKLACDDGADPVNFPFARLYYSIKDIPARAFLESIEAIYQRFELPNHTATWRGELVHPEQITDVALMTVEAADDDIAGPGQTVAAHDLTSGLANELHHRVQIPRGGHFALIHGPTCRERVVPSLAQFFSRYSLESKREPLKDGHTWSPLAP